MNKARPLVAVVDDEKPVRIAVERLLRSANFDVETFPSGDEFLDSLKTHRPDCVVLDLHMPQVDGFTVQARLTDASIRLSVVIITGHDTTETRDRALAGGASAYLRKPMDDQTLLDAITNAIAHAPVTTPRSQGLDEPQTGRIVMNAANHQGETGPWNDPALAQLREWDPTWSEQCLQMAVNPWTNGILPRKTIELISIAVNAACTNLNADGTRRHIRGALDVGATREEILMVLKMASLLSIHTCSLAAPIILEEAKAAGVTPTTARQSGPTPVCDKMKAAGQWNTAWDPFFELDPVWTEAIIAASVPVYTSGVFSPKLAEFLSIAVDASITHMYAPGTRRHIKAALKLGATMEEIMEVLKVCVAQGVQASNLGIPLLAEELARVTKA